MRRELMESDAPGPAVAEAATKESAFALLLRTMRPRQWSKNLILFAALIFSRNLLDLHMLLRSAAACAVFCLLSGMVYTINDLLDLQEDRLHQTKQRRPLASGALSPRLAVGYCLRQHHFCQVP